MKKLFVLFAAAAMTLTASAQALEESKTLTTSTLESMVEFLQR